MRATAYDDALADAKKATQLAPKSPDAWMVVGKIQVSYRKNAEAVVSFRNAVAQASKSLNAPMNLSLDLAEIDDAGC